VTLIFKMRVISDFHFHISRVVLNYVVFGTYRSVLIRNCCSFHRSCWFRHSWHWTSRFVWVSCLCRKRSLLFKAFFWLSSLWSYLLLRLRGCKCLLRFGCWNFYHIFHASRANNFKIDQGTWSRYLNLLPAWELFNICNKLMSIFLWVFRFVSALTRYCKLFLKSEISLLTWDCLELRSTKL